MNELAFIIFSLAIMAVGFLLGAIVMAFILRETLEEFQEKTRKLRKENETLKKHEVIEIVDRRTDPDNYFTPF